jgi:hypothetical protein
LPWLGAAPGPPMPWPPSAIDELQIPDGSLVPKPTCQVPRTHPLEFHSAPLPVMLGAWVSDRVMLICPTYT